VFESLGRDRPEKRNEKEDSGAETRGEWERDGKLMKEEERDFLDWLVYHQLVSGSLPSNSYVQQNFSKKRIVLHILMQIL